MADFWSEWNKKANAPVKITATGGSSSVINASEERVSFDGTAYAIGAGVAVVTAIAYYFIVPIFTAKLGVKA